MSIARRIRQWRNSWSAPRTADLPKRSIRRATVETMEPRLLFNADPIWLGGVYVESDIGHDDHGDLFYVSFKGGAQGTKLDRLILNTDQNATGYSVGDNIFDTLSTGLGADHAIGFKIEKLQTANPNAKVTATVDDASMKLVLQFENFYAGDLLVFSIDVDEVQHYDPSETNLDIINGGLDPITSGVEFQGSKLFGEFSAPHYEIVNGTGTFLNAYNTIVDPAGLPIPRDDDNGLRDRSAGTALSMQQIPKPISLAGTVYYDNDMDLTQDAIDQGIAGVQLELWLKQGNTYVNTGHKTTTDAQGNYRFGVELKLQPGTYQIREAQPQGYLSVGAVPGSIAGVGTVGQTVSNNKDVLTEITIAKGDQHAVDLDFAEIMPASISGHVCLVMPGFDCFSTAPNSKTPLSGVLIDLLDAQGNKIASTTTAADGSYRFEQLPAGVYTVVEHTPPQYIDGAAKVGTIAGSTVGKLDNSNRISQIIVAGGMNGVDYDFCELLPGSLSGHVYEDKNDDGIRSNTEAFIAGVVVRLLDQTGKQVAQTTTDANGYYKFSFLGPGTYCIVEETPNGYIDGKDRAGTILGNGVGQAINPGDKIKDIVLPSGRDGVDYDFGELKQGSISGKVFVDFDGDCYKDPGVDQPISNVLVQLLDAQGKVIQETRTDAQGNYRFDGLRPGVYAVREIQPAGYLQGGQTVGSGGGDATLQDHLRNIGLQSGDHFVDYDFCEIPPADIAGWVFVDSNGDCLFQPNEAPIAGVRIDLLDGAGNLLQTTYTLADGSYRFTQLPPGTYAVKEYQPVGYYQGGQKAGSHGGDDSLTDLIRTIPIEAGAHLIDYNFCEKKPASLGGKVFVDKDNDCVQDSDEFPLANVKIELLDKQGNVVKTTFTDTNGQYRFVDLEAGEYSVRETQPAEYFQGNSMAPAGRAVSVNPDLLGSIGLLSGEDLRNLDFCELPPAMISGYVFQDGATIISSDGSLPKELRPVRNGLRTADDTPIAGVVLELRNGLGLKMTPDQAMAGYYSGDSIRVVTDANGYFEFRGLMAGTYSVYEVHPDGYEDGIDTPGPNGIIAVNPEDFDDGAALQGLIETLMLSGETDPRNDAILLISLNYGEHAQENNFSEVKVSPLPPPPPEPPKLYNPPPTPNGYVQNPFETVLPPGLPPALHEDLLVGGGVVVPYTWHLSVVNSGTPRGYRQDKVADKERIVRATTILDVTQWTVAGMHQGKWNIVSANAKAPTVKTPKAFSLGGAKALAGDFNGDGTDELALFHKGEWLLDVNGNGEWDKEDLWARLGDAEDIPVVGDWDGDGKDDIGIFGPEWEGDPKAIAKEPGLPDPDNLKATRPKNVPPSREEAPPRERLMQRSPRADGRADLVDHIFRFGEQEDQAIAGDFNGDGISSVGVFRGGKWHLDLDGDGKFTERDAVLEFGRAGDKALTGDFDGDGIDELAIVRGNQVIVDSNHNGEVDPADKVFELESTEGQVVVGDFDGDGIDEVALHQSIETPDGKRQAAVPVAEPRR
ncbi:MAG: SdrD B-like domain-containing protein [Pirellulales bacterium]